MRKGFSIDIYGFIRLNILVTCILHCILVLSKFFPLGAYGPFSRFFSSCCIFEFFLQLCLLACQLDLPWPEFAILVLQVLTPVAYH